MILVVVFLPIGYMVWRFKQGEEMVAGGSLGRQLSGKDDDDQPDDHAGPETRR